MSTFFITTADLDDCAGISQLVNDAYRPPAGMEGWTHENNWVDGPRVNEQAVFQAVEATCVLVARQSINTMGLRGGGSLLGCVQVQIEAQKAFIGMLAVWPCWQGKGIGGQLFDSALNFAKNGKCDQAIVFVVNKRHDLIQYYERLGFTRTGNVTQYPVGQGVGTPKHPNQLYLLELSYTFQNK